MSSNVYSLEHDREAAIAAAKAAIAEGQCVVLPTDTVYGIAANAFNADAVQGLLDAKERGRDMPPPVLIAEPLMLRAIADEVPEGAAALAKAFWPGALTLILKAQPRGGMDLGETQGTIAVRVPDQEETRQLLRATGPLAVSSANVSGQPAALTVEAAQAQLGDRVAVYLDGGISAGGVASTIVDFAATEEGRVLRAGAISYEQLRDVAPALEDLYVEPVIEETASESEADTPELSAEAQQPAVEASTAEEALATAEAEDTATTEA